MLNDFQIQQTWESMLNAEARSLYFADLASRFTIQKQIITGCSFFLSSGAAAAVIGKSPVWVPITSALLAASANAYSIAYGLDKKVGTMVKLYSAWSRISTDYRRLWNHAYDEEAEISLDAITQREIEPSELAATEAPNAQNV